MGVGHNARSTLRGIYRGLARAQEVEGLAEHEFLDALGTGRPDVVPEVPTPANPRSLEESLRATKSKAKVSKLVLNRAALDDLDEMLMDLDASRPGKRGEFCPPPIGLPHG